jgi:aminoglycoside phosphotransferase (APT) family kinase protein
MPRKICIDTPLVRSLIAAQFPEWAALPVDPVIPGGWDNRTFRLGADMLIRMPSARRYTPQVAREHRWLPRLAPHLPLPIPTPLARGKPGPGYPWPWSVYDWIEGTPVSTATISDMGRLALDVGMFLAALQRAPTTDGPRPGAHNFHRGGTLAVYDAETRRALADLAFVIDAPRLTRIWEDGLASHWQDPAVWVHGDIATGNLLTRNGRLAAVIDFGCATTGDPACDLVIAWTLLDPASRAVFRSVLPLDPDTWARAKGWALWKALITLRRHLGTDPQTTAAASATLTAILSDRD